MITFEVEVDTRSVGVEIDTPSVGVSPDSDNTVIFAVAPGDRGAQGEQGQMFDGIAWFSGEGPPTPSPVGAKVGDFYFDILTGLIYKLGD